ncbi:FecCD family ABC transporter permease [Falsihalocynthiibacter arcticus]|uniref:Iron ABC transporter n=1 Tax=Falsihalocynthiibacter arcticus TaxID=1579316 RepID=A0A126V0G9_9RHOB|nr:iron ABC transporter permease [Falsihalocynthiibacter arcticus]AML51803.1 iron ABC transporter [Falsihalocynthiibacter arcticus]
MTFILSLPERVKWGVDRQARARFVTFVLFILLIVLSIFSLGYGAAGTPFISSLIDLVTGKPLSTVDTVILRDIRLPRMIMAISVGASLAVSGVVMQGLFRNPLADPGLVGVGSGAALGAILAIVLGGMLPLVLREIVGYYLVPIAAFLGGWATTLLLYKVATQGGRTSVAMMLLAGIALGALAGAISGVLVYMADDGQLRDLTFWGMGSLAGATWSKALVACPLMFLSIALSLKLGRGLNSLALGEAAASHMGVPVQRLKNGAIMLVAAGTGAAVAVSGGIGFIGIVVPHLLRISTGPDHRLLLPNAALLGASFLVAADMISRTVIAPAELPIGIITAILGGPVFLWILFRQKGMVGL